MTSARAKTVVVLSVSGLALALASASCTFEAGHGFATLTPLELALGFDPGARLDPDTGRFLVMGGARVEARLMRLEVEAVAIDQLVAGGGGGGGVFDPAHPPAGYTLCHNGHCHTVDGRLVDYEDIQAELSGGGASTYVEVVSMPVADEIDLLARTTIALDRFEPSAELDRGTLARVRVVLTRFVVEGTVTGGPFEERVVPFEIDLDLGEGAQLSSIGASRVVDRDAPEEVRVRATATLGGTFLDGLDLGALEQGGAVRIARGAEAEAVGEALLSVVLAVTME